MGTRSRHCLFLPLWVQHCKLCKDNHLLYQCSKFAQYSVQQRFDFAKGKRLCMNCLSPTHKTAECTSKHSCHECSGKRYSLLHFNQRTKKILVQMSTMVISKPCPQLNVTPGPSTSVGQDILFVGIFQSSGNVILEIVMIRVHCSIPDHRFPSSIMPARLD